MPQSQVELPTSKRRPGDYQGLDQNWHHSISQGPAFARAARTLLRDEILRWVDIVLKTTSNRPNTATTSENSPKGKKICVVAIAVKVKASFLRSARPFPRKPRETFWPNREIWFESWNLRDDRTRKKASICGLFWPFCQQKSRDRTGWGAWIRTRECRNQNPVPYHLATPQHGRRAPYSGGRWSDQRSCAEDALVSTPSRVTHHPQGSRDSSCSIASIELTGRRQGCFFCVPDHLIAQG
jgi:hypothetical protein